MRGPLTLIVGLALFSSVIFAVFSGFMAGGLHNDSVIQGHLIIALVILFPINMVGAYLASRGLKRQVAEAGFKEFGILWLVQATIVSLLAGIYPVLLAVSALLIYVGDKHQSAQPHNQQSKADA